MMQQNTLFEEPLRLSVTGHRPPMTGGYGENAYNTLYAFARIQLMKLKPTEVNTGMALGWDQAIADACVELNIPFNAYVVNCQCSVWNAWQKGRFENLLKKAKSVTKKGEADSAGYLSRNHVMVDNCTQLLALFNGDYSTGTGSTVRYARGKNKIILNVWDDWKEYIK